MPKAHQGCGEMICTEVFEFTGFQECEIEMANGNVAELSVTGTCTRDWEVPTGAHLCFEMTPERIRFALSATEWSEWVDVDVDRLPKNWGEQVIDQHRKWC